MGEREVDAYPPSVWVDQWPSLATSFPLQHSRMSPNPKFVQNLSQRLFLRVPVKATEICQTFVKIYPKLTVFQISTNFVTNLGPP